MRPMPIQPIFCVFFVAMFLTPVLSGAVLSQGADTATAWQRLCNALSRHARAHYPRRDMAHDLAQVSATASAKREDGPLRRVWRNLFPFVVVGAIWEVVAHAGLFPPRFFPPLEAIAAVFARLTMSGVLPHHALDTLARLMAGFALAALIGVTIGILMGRSRRAEDILLPLVSIGAPIPGLAYAPLFLLWFGPGNIPAIALVAFVSAFPVIYNSWTGVKAVKEICLRSAQAMGADDRRLFRHVVLPGALPYTGLRLGL